MKKNPDVITVSWSTEDVISRAEERDIKLSQKTARKILAEVDRRHDASIGINWDVIDTFTDSRND